MKLPNKYSDSIFWQTVYRRRGGFADRGASVAYRTIKEALDYQPCTIIRRKAIKNKRGKIIGWKVKARYLR